MKLEIIDVYKDESYVPTEPVSLAEIKAWCLVDYSDDDTLLTELGIRSRKAVEDFANISITPKTISLTCRNGAPLDPVQPWFYPNYKWDANFFGYPLNEQFSELPWGPVSTVASVTRIDPSGATILVADQDYFLAGQLFKQIRVLNWSGNLLIIYYTPYYCPDPLKEAILTECAFGYENRGSGLNRYASQNVGVCERAQVLARKYLRKWF
jgi:hypothetical protein